MVIVECEWWAVGHCMDQPVQARGPERGGPRAGRAPDDLEPRTTNITPSLPRQAPPRVVGADGGPTSVTFEQGHRAYDGQRSPAAANTAGAACDGAATEGTGVDTIADMNQAEALAAAAGTWEGAGERSSPDLDSEVEEVLFRWDT